MGAGAVFCVAAGCDACLHQARAGLFHDRVVHVALPRLVVGDQPSKAVNTTKEKRKKISGVG
jgi:hypothetical protein